MARLECLGISHLLSPVIINKLNDRKIFSASDFIGETTDNLVKFTGLVYKDIWQIRQEIVKKHAPKSINALELFENLEKPMSTGIPSLDTFLSGGLHQGHIYELCGASSSGKSSICLSISTNIALNSKSIVHYVDTKNDFSSTRIQMILDENKINNEEIARVMSQIKVTKVSTITQLFSFLYNQCSTVARLIIIDSLPSLFHLTTDSYKTMYSLNHLANMCHHLANERRLTVITVNSVTQWREEEAGLLINNKNIQTIIRPLLGKWWKSVPNTRIYVEEEIVGGRRKLSFWKTHEKEVDGSIEIKITNSGIS